MTPALPATGKRACVTDNLSGPDLGVNFDLVVATEADLQALFPEGVRESRPPEGPWPQYVHIDRTAIVAQRNVTWIDCENLYDDAFEALAEALNVPAPAPTPREKALGITPDRLVHVLHFNPEAGTTLSQFPSSFVTALANVRDATALGKSWSNALRNQRQHEAALAASHHLGNEDPRLDAEQFAPYFSKLAADLVALATQATTTGKNLYLHSWPD
jgi:hypothetical protein